MDNWWRGSSKPKYESADQIAELIDAYFEDCEGTLLTNPETGDPILDKYMQPVYVGRKQPTSAGLARALGFNSRQSLLNYKAKKEFKSTIEAAMLRLEEYTEQRLFDKDGANGAKFSLQFNFKGWKEEKADGNGAPAVNIICDIPHASATVETANGTDQTEVKAENGGKD